MEPDSTGLTRVREAVRKLHPEMLRLRRDFHQHPEPGFAETRTAAKVVEWLEACGGFEIRSGVAKTGVVADIRGGEGPMVLLRADMDALRIQEANEGLDYRSRNPGVMHACGHDAHTAILLGVARVLAGGRSSMKGGVRLIFQPAEEGPGGAEPMIAAGVLENPRPAAVFALHVWSKLPIGSVAATPGPVMASTAEFEIRVRGKGGHGAVPQETIDPIVAVSHLIVAMQTIVSRNVDPLDAAVLSVGKIRGGEVMNAIADQVTLNGTRRSYLPDTERRITERLQEVARGVDAAFGTQTEIEIIERYPAVFNDPRLTALVGEVAEEVLGAGRLESDLRLMGGEDMAFYQKEIPGCFFFLGAGNPSKGIDRSHHHPEFNIDEDAMPLGAEILLRLVERHVGALGASS